MFQISGLTLFNRLPSNSRTELTPHLPVPQKSLESARNTRTSYGLVGACKTDIKLLTDATCEDGCDVPRCYSQIQSTYSVSTLLEFGRNTSILEGLYWNIMTGQRLASTAISEDNRIVRPNAVRSWETVNPYTVGIRPELCNFRRTVLECA